MKVKVKQSMFMLDFDRVVNVNEEVEVNDAVGKDLVDADYATKVVEEDVKEPAKPKAKKEKESKVEGE